MKNTGAERLRDVERQFAGGDDEARSSSSKTSFNGAPPTPDPMKSRKPKRTERSPKRDQPKKKQKKPTSYDLSLSFFSPTVGLFCVLYLCSFHYSKNDY